MADRTTRFNNWFQIISNVAIIVGLGLVIYELNQAKQLAWGQMAEDQMNRWSDRSLAMMGDDPRDAFAKAVLNPGDLDHRDAVTLDAFYDSVVLNWTFVYFSAETTEINRQWRSLVALETPKYFSSVPGRRWLRDWTATRQIAGHKQIAEVALGVLEKTPTKYRANRYQLLLGEW